MIDPVICQQAIEALTPFDSPDELTPDERVCLKIVREALQAIAGGQDLTPPESPPWKRRLLRHVSVSYFAPDAKPPPKEPEPPGDTQ